MASRSATTASPDSVMKYVSARNVAAGSIVSVEDTSAPTSSAPSRRNDASVGERDWTRDAGSGTSWMAVQPTATRRSTRSGSIRWRLRRERTCIASEIATRMATMACTHRVAAPTPKTATAIARPARPAEIRSRTVKGYQGRSGTKTSSPGAIGKLGRDPSAISSTGIL